MMKLSWRASLVTLIYTPLLAVSQGGQGSDPYVPVYAECPAALSIRDADGLSASESSWRASRSEQIIPALQSYLELADISGFNVGGYIQQLNASNSPVVGLSVSGGGTQSGIGGLGVWQAYDARYQPAVDARTGGLVQVLSYITGLSGGGAVTVALLATNNFTTTDNIRQSTNFSASYAEGPSGNSTAFFETIFENAGAKAEAGFPVSVADTFGQFWGTWLPEEHLFSNYSDLASNDSGNAFALGAAPMPIMVLAEVIPGESPEIEQITYPGRNSTNGFNLTSYEVTPYEFGSWLGGRVQGFMPTVNLGTAMANGTAQNDSQCVQGFDKMTLIQGTTTDAFSAWLIDDFYSIPIFAKRDVPIPEGEEQNPLVQLVNQTASNFGLTFNASLWGTYPNPFLGYNEAMNDVDELLLIDGSLTGETNPIRPLIIPDREVDFIIVYEATSEAKYHWVNGTNLINTAQSATQGSIPFPEIPDVDTLITQNLTRQPTFFGCNATSSDDTQTPLVLWLPNSPWSGYSNFSYMKDAFTDNELDVTLENAFQLATYGNGTVDTHWPACLACAVVKSSIQRLGIDMPQQCSACFQRHCWNGTTAAASDTVVTEADLDPTLRLVPDLSYEEWNDTAWAAGPQEQGSDGEDSDGEGKILRRDGSATYAIIVAIVVTMVL